MKIFLPFKRELNPYLDEIEQYSKFDFIYSFYTEYQPTFKIVNIHWPEAIFDWLEPTDGELESLEIEIRKWKKNSKIVYTLHDERRHKGMTERFEKLFQMIESNADIFIHLGKYSKRKYKLKYPKANHYVLYHPIYENAYTQFDQNKARQKLGINQNAIVFCIPGQIRNKKEKHLVLRAFKKLQLENKVLLAPRMRNELEFDFKGRIRLKRIFDLRKFVVNRFRKKYQPPVYYFNYCRTSAKEFSYFMAASNLVIIPRINTLNSGILFLGLSFNKIVIGPDIGNISEHLRKLEFPVYNPGDHKSLTSCLKKAMTLFNEKYKPKKDLISYYQPELLANKLENILKEEI